jgi:ADP-ribosyl-[dinitrogen reductase] hydrolase
MESTLTLEDRIEGALLGLAAGDCLGAPIEFMSPSSIQNRYGVLRDVVGGGSFQWRPGQGTDDSDMAAAILRAYQEGYSLEGVGKHFLAWYETRPRDIGGTTRQALSNLERGVDPRESGINHDRAAANGSIMRCLPTGLVRKNDALRRQESAEISAVTHAEPRCLYACMIYCDVVSYLLDGLSAKDALKRSISETPVPAHAWDEIFFRLDLDDDELARGEGMDYEAYEDALVSSLASLPVEEIPTSGYVYDTLRAGLWSVLQEASAEETLIAIVNRGDDADSVGAVAGGLLGARDGVAAWPERWLSLLEYRQEFSSALNDILALRA